MRYYVTGFPGSGKTFWGKQWALKHGLVFYDLDELIANEERLSVPEIFLERGEDYFREKEAAVLRNTDRFKDCIIACGGGTPCYYDNMDWMTRNGTVIFLAQTEAILEKNITEDDRIRPLFGGTGGVDLREKISETLARRLPFYLQAAIHLQPDQIDEFAFSAILTNNKNA